MSYAPKQYYKMVNSPSVDIASLGLVASNPLEIRAKILRLEQAIKDGNFPQPDCPLTHHFAPGLYAREILLPKDSVVVGKIHKHAHVNTISKGSCLVVTEFGEMKIEAPCTFVSQPGTKRTVIALEDTIWTTYHPSNETDLAVLEDQIIAKTYEDIGLLDMPAETLKLKE